MGLTVAALMVFDAVPGEITALVATLLSLMVSFFFLRSRAVFITVGVAALAGFFYTGSLISVASVVATVFLIGLGAVVMLHIRPPLLILMGAAAFGVTLLITGDPMASSAVLRLIPCALVLSVLLARGTRRTTCIWAVSALFLIIWLAPMLWQIHGEYGDLSEAVFTRFFDDLRAEYIRVCLEAAEMLTEELIATGQIKAEYLSLLSEETFHTVLDTVLCLLPAILAIIASLVGFAAQALSLTFCRATGYALKLPPRTQLFAMTKISAVVFLIALLLPILGLGKSNDAQVISLAAENINLMLMPAFLWVGGVSVVSFFRHQRGCLNVWVLLTLAFFLIYVGALLIYPLAIFGAFVTLRARKDPDDLSQLKP